MWTVVKIKKRELNIFKKNLADKIGKDIKFYYPKIEYHKHIKNKVRKFEKLILENYIFCHHKKFKDQTNITKVKFVRGLEYFINGYEKNQNEIVKFIDHCKSFEIMKVILRLLFLKLW